MSRNNAMTNKIVQLLPVAIIVAALLVSMYLIFDTSIVATESEANAKQIVAGASCVVPEIAVDPAEEEIHFVGCGGFF